MRLNEGRSQVVEVGGGRGICRNGRKGRQRLGVISGSRGGLIQGMIIVRCGCSLENAKNKVIRSERW